MDMLVTATIATTTAPHLPCLNDTPPAVRARAMVCCCPGCGSEVTFDALVVSCRCSDEPDSIGGGTQVH
jgi:hypothetical protein